MAVRDDHRSVILKAGLTATYFEDRHYKYVRLTGLDDTDKPFELTLSSFIGIPNLLDLMERWVVNPEDGCLLCGWKEKDADD
jgi:hypothetical protein